VYFAVVVKKELDILTWMTTIETAGIVGGFVADQRTIMVTITLLLMDIGQAMISSVIGSS